MYTVGVNAVIFDFDGTLADSFDEVLAFFSTQGGRDPKTLTADEHQRLRGLSMRDLALASGIPSWRLPFVYFRSRAKLSKRMNLIQPFDGMNDVLAGLHAENYQMYMISSNSTRNINRFLVHHGMSGYFKKVYGSVGWFGKGNILKKAVARHNLKAETTVYVGDEVRDLVGAKIAGMPSVAVSWGFGSEEQLLRYTPTILVRTPAELKKALIEWGKIN